QLLRTLAIPVFSPGDTALIGYSRKTLSATPFQISRQRPKGSCTPMLPVRIVSRRSDGPSTWRATPILNRPSDTYPTSRPTYVECPVLPRGDENVRLTVIDASGPNGPYRPQRCPMPALKPPCPAAARRTSACPLLGVGWR